MGKGDFIAKAAPVLALWLAACSGPPVDRDLPEPVQRLLPEAKLPATARMRRLAEFSSETLVLSRRDYSLNLVGDPMSEYAPVDLVMAWGSAARAGVRDGVAVRQSTRRYVWWAGPRQWERPETKKFGLHTANWHMVPSDPAVAKRLAEVEEGDVVRIRGALVAVRLVGGRVARSSLKRDDDGDGACEIVLVEAIEIGA